MNAQRGKLLSAAELIGCLVVHEKGGQAALRLTSRRKNDALFRIVVIGQG